MALLLQQIIQLKLLPGMSVLQGPASWFCGCLRGVPRGLLLDLIFFLQLRSLSSRNPVEGLPLRPFVYQTPCQEMKRLEANFDKVATRCGLNRVCLSVCLTTPGIKQLRTLVMGEELYCVHCSIDYFSINSSKMLIYSQCRYSSRLSS